MQDSVSGGPFHVAGHMVPGVEPNMASEWKGFTPFRPLTVLHKVADYNFDSDIC